VYAVIKQIFDSIPELVSDSYYGRKILAAYTAYGGGYDFCKFYSCFDCGDRCNRSNRGHRSDGIIHIYSTSMVIDGNVDADEAEMFINLTKPVTIEISSRTALHLGSGYRQKHRTLFRVRPRETDIAFEDVKVNSYTDVCYDILSKSFDTVGSYDEWYVDISHKIRHSVSELYLYDSTTVTQQFNINGFIFLSHIATAPEARGKGMARRLLYCLGREAEKRSADAYLFALDHRRSFYETIGFEPVYEDILYEMEG